MKDQRIQERPVLVAVGGMDQHSRRLVHHNEMVVLIDDLEWNIFGSHRVLAGQIKLDLQEISATKPVSDILKAAVNFTLLVLNQPAEIHAAETRKPFEQKVLEPDPAL